MESDESSTLPKLQAREERANANLDGVSLVDGFKNAPPPPPDDFDAALFLFFDVIFCRRRGDNDSVVVLSSSSSTLSSLSLLLLFGNCARVVHRQVYAVSLLITLGIRDLIQAKASVAWLVQQSPIAFSTSSIELIGTRI